MRMCAWSVTTAQPVHGTRVRRSASPHISIIAGYHIVRCLTAVIALLGRPSSVCSVPQQRRRTLFFGLISRGADWSWLAGSSAAHRARHKLPAFFLASLRVAAILDTVRLNWFCQSIASYAVFTSYLGAVVKHCPRARLDEFCFVTRFFLNSTT